MLKFSLYLITFALLITCCRSSTVTFETDPSPGSNESVVYIAAEEWQQNITVKCAVSSGNTLVRTIWRDVRENQIVIFSIIDGVSTNYNYLSVSGVGDSELKISTFTSDLDRIMLACGTGSNGDPEIVFFYGIPAITILNSSDIYTITESEDFTLDLTNYNKTSFPPIITAMWTLDGIGISNEDSPFVTVTAYSITIRNITRNYTGRIFNVTVANIAGKRSQRFTIDVVYSPEVDRADTLLYSSVGNSINITATNRIDGNPIPTVTWVSPNDTVITPSDKYHFMPAGVLSISNLQLSDFGIYRFTASNGVGNDQILNISLILLVQPGQPRNLSYTILDDTSGLSLEWLPPTQPGVPAFTGYIVTLVKEDEMSNILVHSYTTDNKVLELADILSPGTTYNISVRATSVFFTDGGNESELVSFKQPTTGARIDSDSVVGVSQDGHILLQWSLQTTGGHNIDNIQVKITCHTVTNTGGRTAEYICNQNCFRANLTESQLVEVGPVDAGFKYVCSLTVSTVQSFETVTSSDIDSITGIPSAPSVMINDDNVMHLLTRFVGTTSINDFRFNVEIKNSTNMVVNASVYVGMSERYVTMDTLASGVYQVEVTSENSYGASDVTRVEFLIEKTVTSSPTVGITDANEFDIAFVAGIGGAGVGVVLLVILIVVIFVGFAVHRKTKYNSTTFVSNGTIPEKRKFDRARIPSVGSTVLY